MEIDIEKATQRIHRRILADVRDRRGWKQEYDQFAPNVQREINSAWKNIIRCELLLASGELAKLKKRGGR